MSLKVGYFMRANDGIYAAVREALPAGCELVTLAPGDDPAEKAKGLGFLIAGKVTREMIEAAPGLRLIQTPGVGYDGIDLAAAAARGIPVAFTVCGNTDEVAEHTLLLMLAVSRRLVELDAALRAGRWLMWDRRLQSFNLKGRTLGLIGFGRIGQAVAVRAAAFGMEIQYADPVAVPGWRRADLDELLGTSDYASLHVPLTPATRGLLDARRIGLMKRGAVLINTSRGEAVNEGALIEALRGGRLAGAGLDVFAKEPPSQDNPLLSMPNVVVTPHVGSGTADGLRVKAAWYAANIRRVLSGEAPLDCVPAAKE
jgi:phosphoglycerate dehydrogenase-like enzyme